MKLFGSIDLWKPGGPVIPSLGFSVDWTLGREISERRGDSERYFVI